MFEYLKSQYNNITNNSHSGGSNSSPIPLPTVNINNISSRDKIIIIDSKSVIFNKSNKWLNNNEQSTSIQNISPYELLKNICFDPKNQNRLIAILLDTSFYPPNHLNEFNQQLINEHNNKSLSGNNFTPNVGIQNLVAVPYNGTGGKKQAMEELFKFNSPVEQLLKSNSNLDLIYISRNHMGNSPNNIKSNNNNQEQIIEKTINKFNLKSHVNNIKVSTAHIPTDIFYKYYLNDYSKLMYQSGAEMMTALNTSPDSAHYSPFMMNPVAYKLNNQRLWPSTDPNRDKRILENSQTYNQYKNNNKKYNNLYNADQVNIGPNTF